jgi:hypothetical protein
VRWAAAARAAWGVVLIAAPERVLATGRGRSDRSSRAVLRLLGIRHLLQAAVVAGNPTPAAQDIGIAVDLIHAGSAAAFAAVDRDQRRFALTETTVAAGWAAAAWGIRHRQRPSQQHR